jgi:hypothetical protein
VHHALVGHVGIGEDDLVDLVLADKLLEGRLGQDRDSLRVQRPRQLGGVETPVDVRNLRRREGDDVVLLPAAVDDVEVVEVAARGPGDQHSSPGHA